MAPRHALLAAAAAAAALLGGPARALDLLEAWRAAAAHDTEFAAARAARDAGQARGRQASALWRPNVTLQAGAGIATQESATRGARFAAPGFGQSNGVAFDTSVNNGTSSRYALALRQPLLDRERGAQAEQLRIAASASEIEWHAAEQAVMLRSAEIYLEAALADWQLRLLREQEAAAEKARVEAQDRFKLGDKPVTDVHEAASRAAAVRAQRVAAESALALRRARLADLMGAAPEGELALPSGAPAEAPGALDDWLQRSAAANPQVLLAQAQVRTAEQELRKSDSALSPTLEAVAQIGRDRLSGDGDFGSASQTATQRSIGVQLTVPLYTGGLRSARRDEARALLARAQAALERAREEAARQVHAAWLDLTAGSSRVEALQAGLQASQARLDATAVGLQAGDRTTLDLLNAQNDATSAQLALAQARVQLLTSRLRLAALAGELDEARLRAANEQLARAAATSR
jgi:outer membrane protein